MPVLTLGNGRRQLTLAARFARAVRLLSVLTGLVLPALLVLLFPGCGRGKPETRQKGELPYALLDKAFQPLRRDFEDADGKVRIVGLVAPTCGECIANVVALDNQLLPAVPGEDLEVLLVWVCAVPPDVEVRARALSERFADPRIRHYWDSSGRLARAFGRHVGLPDGLPAYGLWYLYGRNDTWDPEGKMGTEPADRNAALDGWEPSPPRARAGQHPRLTLPQFIVETLRSQIEQLRAQPDEAGGANR